MDDDRLIDFVRLNREIYDFDHPKYMDSVHKERLWNKIGQELNQSGPICKTRWNNIRDNYRKWFKRISGKSEEEIVKIKKYKFGNELCFLDRYFKDTGNSNNDNNNSNQVWEDEKQPLQNIDVIKVECDATIYPSIENNEDPLEFQFENKQPSTTNSSSAKESNRKLKEASNLMKYIFEKNEIQLKSSSQDEAVDTFLACLAPTLKTFTPYYLNLAKTKIFAAVQEFEMAMILNKQKETINSIHSLSSAYGNSHTSSSSPSNHSWQPSTLPYIRNFGSQNISDQIE